ncbi:Ankyrin-2 [Sesbania bispinosa]|nr:Ankyrin-2 [Sesbania bispinosa]
MARERKELAFARDENNEIALHLLAQNQKCILNHMKSHHPSVTKLLALAITSV